MFLAISYSESCDGSCLPFNLNSLLEILFSQIMKWINSINYILIDLSTLQKFVGIQEFKKLSWILYNWCSWYLADITLKGPHIYLVRRILQLVIAVNVNKWLNTTYALWGPNQISFLNLQGILHLASTLQGPILTPFPNPAGQIQLYQGNL